MTAPALRLWVSTLDTTWNACGLTVKRDSTGLGVRRGGGGDTGGGGGGGPGTEITGVFTVIVCDAVAESP
jgi:hypothetical protein